MRMQGKGFIFRASDLFLLSLGTEFCPPRGPAPARSHILQGPVLYVDESHQVSCSYDMIFGRDTVDSLVGLNLLFDTAQIHCIQIVTENCQILPKIVIFLVKIGQILIGKQRQATPYH
jgi:hypothetical protein